MRYNISKIWKACQSLCLHLSFRLRSPDGAIAVFEQLTPFAGILQLDGHAAPFDDLELKFKYANLQNLTGFAASIGRFERIFSQNMLNYCYSLCRSPFSYVYKIICSGSLFSSNDRRQRRTSRCRDAPTVAVMRQLAVARFYRMRRKMHSSTF